MGSRGRADEPRARVRGLVLAAPARPTPTRPTSRAASAATRSRSPASRTSTASSTCSRAPGCDYRSHGAAAGRDGARGGAHRRAADARARTGARGGPARRPDHREPQLDADAAGLRADRAVRPAHRAATAWRSSATAPLNPADPSQPLWQVSQALLEAQARAGMEFEPATVGDATGMWDPLGVVTERLALLKADRRARSATRPRAPRSTGRIAELEFAVANPHGPAGRRAQLRRALRLHVVRARRGRGHATRSAAWWTHAAVAGRLLARRVGPRPAVPVHEGRLERALTPPERGAVAATRSVGAGRRGLRGGGSPPWSVAKYA